MIFSYYFERKYGKENVKNLPGKIQFLVGFGDVIFLFSIIILIVEVIF